MSALRVLRQVPIDVAGTSRTTVDGRMLDVVDDGEMPELIDPYDVEFEPAQFDVVELRQWTVDLDKLTDLLRRRNAFTGSSGTLASRLVLLGQAEDESPVVLALFPTWSAARSEVDGLRDRLSTTTGKIIVCSRSMDVPVEDVLALQRTGITVGGVHDDGKVTWSDAPVRRQIFKGIGRPRGRGLSSLLDCWTSCHHLDADFMNIHDFYVAVEAYLKAHPGTIDALPAVARFTGLRTNGRAARTKAGRCIWYLHDKPPEPSHLVSY